ncbi:hypothetical protein [Dysgonomonas sp. 25]|uniref:hypothetical protein n=1 Tax=Dysgonomonas sp. 25 TaxID=2302933 RepID=UPI0013D513E7|nr:hypothetical protein [Dysgonomonas sp. 25]NDV70110.1 hypothetical protein [Dysgonomonas sp. 25]
MKLYLIHTIISLIIAGSLLSSCSPKDEGAKKQLEMARVALDNNQFEQAKNYLDSIKTLYPKAFEEQRNAFALLDTVRRAENDYIIRQCDSLVAVNQPKVDSMKKAFHYMIDKNYYDAGIFVPIEGFNDGRLQITTLRSGVKENSGTLYLESVYIGGNQMHNQLKVALKDGTSAESLPVNDDGLNFRFTNLGKQYEIIKFEGNALGEVAQFIASNQDKPITLTLKGNNTYSYQLPPVAKKGVKQSTDLSAAMICIDSLKEEKNKAEFRNYKLTEKQNQQAEREKDETN